MRYENIDNLVLGKVRRSIRFCFKLLLIVILITIISLLLFYSKNNGIFAAIGGLSSFFMYILVIFLFIQGVYYFLGRNYNKVTDLDIKKLSSIDRELLNPVYEDNEIIILTDYIVIKNVVPNNTFQKLRRIDSLFFNKHGSMIINSYSKNQPLVVKVKDIISVKNGLNKVGFDFKL